MKFMRRSVSKGNLAEEVDAAEQQQQQQEQQEPSNEVGSLLKNKDNHVFCTVRPGWTWIMQEVCDRVNNVDNPEQPPQQAQMTLLDNYQELPSGKLASVSSLVAAAKASRTGKSRRNKVKSTAALTHTLRIDIVTNHRAYQKSATTNSGDLTSSGRSWTLQSFHGTSEAFDGLEGKFREELSHHVVCVCAFFYFNI
jgi:hypothetical protein